MQITKKDLYSAVDEINTLTGNPIHEWDKTNGTIKGAIGNYHLYGAYGGWRLDQITNEGGGTRTISTGGCESKKSIYKFMVAFIAGLKIGAKS